MLIAEDIHTASWRRLKSHISARIAELRALNDQPLDQERTAATRGGIAELKKLLDLETKVASSSTETLPAWDGIEREPLNDV